MTERKFVDPGIEAAAYRAYSGPYVKPSDWLDRITYPPADTLRLGTSVPPDHIRKLITAARTGEPFETDRYMGGRWYGSITIGGSCTESYTANLRAYLPLFPDSKWLTPSDRRFLEDDINDDPYRTPIK